MRLLKLSCTASPCPWFALPSSWLPIPDGASPLLLGSLLLPHSLHLSVVHIQDHITHSSGANGHTTPAVSVLVERPPAPSGRAEAGRLSVSSVCGPELCRSDSVHAHLPGQWVARASTAHAAPLDPEGPSRLLLSPFHAAAILGWLLPHRKKCSFPLMVLQITHYCPPAGSPDFILGR
ncbi:hypothetical protein NDU88_002477 [Pleurodeles waltl]|uniref:Uncharacterized protein n=1 Tax=Pleurodeles waltl TaxID=8319 RepID=A0AAV7RDH0_PLEWA|nr:hypothetical protein NDU88_002477 [Pleurodeles waltl]